MRKFDDALRYLQLITSTLETLNLHPRSTVHQNAATFELIRALTMSFSHKKIHDDISNGSRVIMLKNKTKTHHKPKLLKTTHLATISQGGW